MIARVIYVIVLNAAFLVALIWYLPIPNLLEARGYEREQVAAVEKILASDSPGPAPTSRPPPEPAPDDTPPAETESAAPAEETANQAPESAPPASPRKLVATDVVNVRAGDSTDTEIVGRIEKDATVEVMADPGGDWIQVEYGDGTGWVYRPLFRTADE